MHATAHMPSHADVRVSREVAGGLANGFDWFWSVVMTSWSTAVLSWITFPFTEPHPANVDLPSDPMCGFGGMVCSAPIGESVPLW